MGLHEQTDAIHAIEGNVSKAVTHGVDSEEIAERVQEGFADAGLQAVCKISVVGQVAPKAPTGRPKKPRRA